MSDMDFSKIKMIVFDVDGTLAETDEYAKEKLQAFGDRFLRFVPEKIRNGVIHQLVNIGETIVHFGYRILDVIGIDPLISTIHEKVSVGKIYKYRAVEGMEDAVRRLSCSYRLAMLTSGGKKSTEAFFEKFPIDDCFEMVISAQDAKYIKPSPCPLKLIMEKTGLGADECLMVGDTIFDVICAHRAGSRCAAVRTGFDNDITLRTFHADEIFDSVVDLSFAMVSGTTSEGKAK